ncbi:MAG TPA: hypothetical protein VL400_13905 [Polyangiaceae bacterium]|jgi:hypothetical protein|nr:hypothetical protein [Polyangiaceae bacterium]
MRNVVQLVVLSSAMALAAGCSGDATPAAGSAKPSAAATTAAPKSSAPATAAPSASANLPPRSDCPKDSAGPGTLTQPCLGKGTARLMEAKWTTKTDDKGPHFNVHNTSKSVILYGKIAVYFYDKAGKQLEVKDKDKSVPFKTCFGNIFSGVMKPDEKAVITFSCVKKDDVPEGTTAIEAEMVTVGFADASGEKSEFYWSNPDLAPDARPKGGVK